MAGLRSKSWKNFVFALPAAFLLPALVFAGDCPEVDLEAIKWLDRMTRSVDEVSYHGVVTFQRDGQDMQVMQVSRVVDGDTSFERLTQLTGQGAEILRASHPLQCVHPGHKLLRMGQDLQDGECGLSRLYRFRVTEGERVAGRKAVRLEVAPRDLYRYGYILELDRRTGLLLKSVTVGRGSRMLEKFQFADIAYNSRLPEGAEINLVHEAEHPAPGEAREERSLPQAWQVGWLPRGFTATDTPLPNAARRTFTDGLAVFSIFIEELDRSIRPGEGVVRSGSTTSYTRGMNVGDEPVLVTVVGEIPVNTARMVADSVAWTH
ncbi:negative regulator for alginate biosynthesis [Mangrovimicrobium sediminis]|uniref:Negative regulator for alginate biosynthesis n=1 Tax=Mangrovimicrobium sediminis TaxID=2562682 RepID=A0A4Z0M587_9GAMM|nr:MucB/RseB C-terminal domain-containing protein [Haliea sp. SAOS-164]TGD74659.1 negative regulator for alginate biosynthesis [Haliea sp. SAOS-164]